jgi:signal peptidase I
MPHPPTPAPETASAPAAPADGFKRDRAESLRSLAVALAVALALRTLLFQPFTIPSSSMEPGLVTGDYLVVSKFAYGWSSASLPFDPPLLKGRVLGRIARRGDVVVFRLPRDPRQTWVKRVIGLPGDRVQVIGGTVFVNARALARTPLGVTLDHDDPMRSVQQAREAEPDGRAHLTYGGAPEHEGETTGVYVVPADCYFVMGDNRDNSLDSRWPLDVGVGFLPAENVLGKAEIVLASWKAGSALSRPWTWLALEPGRFLRPVR